MSPASPVPENLFCWEPLPRCPQSLLQDCFCKPDWDPLQERPGFWDNR